MENTGKLLFDDESPQWFIAQGEGWIGPLPAGDVYQKIIAQELSWLHYVWRKGQDGWKRICDVETFQAVAPGAPKNEMLKEVSQAESKPAPPPGAPSGPSLQEARVWFLYYNDSQFGPFSHDEVARSLRAGKIHGRVYAWKDGMETWVKLEQVGPFGDAVSESEAAWSRRRAEKSAPAAGKPAASGKLEKADQRSSARAVVQESPAQASSKDVDQRTTPRRPLIARITLAAQESVTVAVCRDISVGGMQVLTDQIPGPAGTRIRLNVSPSNAAREGQIEPFVAEGVVVRVLEDRRGFSFRFDKLADQARRAIESYINSG